MAKGISSALIIIIVIVIGVAVISYSQLQNITKLEPRSIAEKVYDIAKLETQSETKELIWAGHTFEIGKLSTRQYPTSGNAGIQFTDKGFYAPSYSLPRNKLLDVDMNQKIKIKVTGNFEGQLYNMSTVNAGCGENINYYGARCLTTEAYHFSEICIYLVDSKETKYGIRCLGTRDSIIKGNIREHFKFGWFTVEYTGKGVIFEDSSGFKFDFTNDMTTAHRLSSLDKNDKWYLRINSHVNGDGWSRVEINDIEIN